MKKAILTYLLLTGVSVCGLLAQDLDDLVNQLSGEATPNYSLATFKGTTIINGQSVELPGAGDMNFKISHRFGNINDGIYEFFGIGLHEKEVALNVETNQIPIRKHACSPTHIVCRPDFITVRGIDTFECALVLRAVSGIAIEVTVDEKRVGML